MAVFAIGDVVASRRLGDQQRLHDHGVHGWVRTLETLTEEAR